MGHVVKYNVDSFDALAAALAPFLGDVTNSQLIAALRGAGVPDAQLTPTLRDLAHQSTIRTVNKYRSAAGLAELNASDYPEGSTFNLDGTITYPDGSVRTTSRGPVQQGQPTPNIDSRVAEQKRVFDKAVADGNHPAGSVLNSDGSVAHPDGSITNTDGTVTIAEAVGGDANKRKKA